MADIVQIVNVIMGDNLLKSQMLHQVEFMHSRALVSLIAEGDVAGIQCAVEGDFEIDRTFFPNTWQFHSSGNTILAFSTDGSTLDSDLLFEYSGNLLIESVIVVDWQGNSVFAKEIETESPTAFLFEAPHPNPFNPVTQLSYTIFEPANVTLKIYDMQGKEVAELLNAWQTAGTYQLNWDASEHPSGVYVAVLNAAGNVSRQKLVLLK